MKKRVRVKIIVLVVLLVLVCVPMHVYMTDGGSQGWYAVLWQYTDYHEILGDGWRVGPRITLLGFIPIYDGTQIVADDRDRAEAKLTLTETQWPGWTEEQPDPTVTVFEEFSEGTVLYNKAYFGKVSVEKLTEETVVLRFDDSCFVASNGDGTINLSATPLDTVTIARGEEIEVVTATMDAGVFLTIRYE